jgi:carboxypeptidase family protein/TonB-dependent receptor-like protein
MRSSPRAVPLRGAVPAISVTLLLTLVLVASPVPSRGQGTPAPAPGILVGHLVDKVNGGAIPGAQLVILGWELATGSDSGGGFRYEGLSPGSYMLQARAVGYTVAIWIVRVGEAEEQHRTFAMRPLSVELDPVTVEGKPGFAEQRRRDFERRRTSGRGYFITEDEIRHTNATTIQQVLRDVPGVRASCTAAGCVMRMARSPRSCLPEYFVDGFPATLSTTAQLPTVGIVGIEVYRSLSETPQEFIRSDQMCGAIVIWTRSGPS